MIFQIAFHILTIVEALNIPNTIEISGVSLSCSTDVNVGVQHIA